MKYEVGQVWIDANGDWLEIIKIKNDIVTLNRYYIESKIKRFEMEWTIEDLEDSLHQYQARLESKLELALRKIKVDKNE